MAQESEKYDVFFFEAFAEEQEALMAALNKNVKAGYTWKTIQEWGQETVPAGMISIRTQSIIPPAWADQLTAVLSRSTGYDHIHNFLEQTGATIPCGHLPLYCNRAVAEQAMLMWMSLMRRLPQQMKNFWRFNRDGLTGGECYNKTLLIVGVGNIGSEVAKIGRGLGMTVLGVDIVQRYEDVDYVEIEEGMARADVVVCAMNLTKLNQGYFTYELLKKAQPGVIFINIARGELASTDDILKLVQEGHLGGVGLDVYAQENELAVALRAGVKDDALLNVRAIFKLKEFGNVLFTPHNAFNTREAVQRKSEQSARQIEHFLANGRFIWPVPDRD